MIRAMTHLMFQDGKAAEALSLYGQVFPDLHVESDDRYKAGEDGPEGTVRQARATLGGLHLVIIDSSIRYAFDFTPSVSLFVDFATGEAMEAAFTRLSEGGEVLMPPDTYGFSDRFAWATDRFGVSWQLNVPSVS